MSLVASYILMILAILAAIFALECKRLVVSVISLIVMNFFVWGVLLTYGALLIAWIQLIVYGGGFTALFIVVVALTEKQRDEASFDLTRTILAVVSVIVIVGLLIFAVTQFNFPVIVGDVSTPSEIFSLLWETRTTDVILQGILFFVASVAIGTLFLQHNRKKTKEEIKA